MQWKITRSVKTTSVIAEQHCLYQSRRSSTSVTEEAYEEDVRLVDYRIGRKQRTGALSCGGHQRRGAVADGSNSVYVIRRVGSSSGDNRNCRQCWARGRRQVTRVACAQLSVCAADLWFTCWEPNSPHVCWSRPARRTAPRRQTTNTPLILKIPKARFDLWSWELLFRCSK